jgi:hypothetical protein
MPILDICGYCKRKGGYAESDTDKVCKRCKNLRAANKVKKEEEDEPQPENKE